MAAKKSKTTKKSATAKKKPAVAKRAATAKKKPAAAKKKPAAAKKKPAAAKKAATTKKKPAAAKKAAPIKKKPAAAKKAVAQTEMERLLEAADRLEETLIDMDPEDPELDLTLEELEQVLREVLRLDPGNVATLSRLGEFFLDLHGAEDIALEYFEQAFTLQPGNQKLAKLIEQAKARLAEDQD